MNKIFILLTLIRSEIPNHALRISTIDNMLAEEDGSTTIHFNDKSGSTVHVKESINSICETLNAK